VYSHDSVWNEVGGVGAKSVESVETVGNLLKSFVRLPVILECDHSLLKIILLICTVGINYNILRFQDRGIQSIVLNVWKQ
jgi:hypothetical protein